jgi:hypothetical protein
MGASSPIAAQTLTRCILIAGSPVASCKILGGRRGDDEDLRISSVFLGNYYSIIASYCVM